MSSAIYEAMRPYQRYGAKWLRDAGNALLADQPGVGKTIQTLGTIIAKAKADHGHTRREWHLILCPSVAVENVWGPEIEKWLWDHPVEIVLLKGTLAARAKMLSNFTPKPETKHVFVVGNLEIVRIVPTQSERGKMELFDVADAVLPPLFEREWDTVVVDESHRALIRSKGTPTRVRGGFRHLQSSRRIALSGTPMRGKPEQLWGTLNWLYPNVYTSYWKWVAEYYRVMSDGYSDYVLDGFQRGGKKRMAKDLRKVMLRRTKAEIAPELPPKTYAGTHLIPGDRKSPVGIWLDPSPAQKRQMKQMELDGVIYSVEAGEVMAQGHLAVDTRRKMLAQGTHQVIDNKLVPTTDSPKLRWLLEWLDNADGEQIVVASQFTGVLNMFAAELKKQGYSVALLTGKNSKTKSGRDGIRGFQAGEIQVFLLNTSAGGVALTLDRADYLVLLDETFIPDDQEQVEDRIHRVSRIHNVTIYYLRTLGSIEEEVAYVTAARYSVTAYLLDGARGVESARRLYNESRAA